MNFLTKPSLIDSNMDLNETLNRILNWILSISLILGGVSIFIGIKEAIDLNQYDLVIQYLAFFLPILVANLFKSKMKYKLKAFLLLTSIYLLSISNIIEYGFSGAGIPLFYCLFVLATVLFGLREGFFAIAFSIIPMGLIGWLMVNGKLSLGVDLNYISTLPISWFTATSLLVFLGSVMILSLSVIQNNLLFSVEFNHKQADKLSKLNKKLIDLNRDLESRVNVRTQQLKAANLELESFSYSVSHDLKAPLRALSGFSNILLKEYAKELPQDVQRYLGLIESSSNKMRRLIEELLKFSRTGKQDLSIKKVNCTELVKQLMGEFKEESENRGVEMVIGNLPACQADPALLTQLFINLISNAFKFTKGNKNARIEVGSKIINQGETIYFVKDNGVGFNMHYADKLFGVFQRLHSEAEYPGTGVGLAIVQRIITRHGGKVWAEAELGNGAAFYFTIGENNGKDRIY